MLSPYLISACLHFQDFGHLFCLLQQGGIVLQKLCKVGMIRSKRLLADCQCSFEECLRLVILPLYSVKGGQVIEADSHVRMFCPQNLLTNGQSTLIKWLGRLILSLIMVDDSKIIQATGYIGMFRPQQLLIDR